MADGVESPPQECGGGEHHGSVHLPKDGVWLLTQVIFQDQSDQHAEFLWECDWLLHPSEKRLELQGTLFAVGNLLDDSGKVFVKHAPLPPSREDKATIDFRALPTEGGFSVELAEPELWSTVEYSGGALGRAAALQAWQRSLRPRNDAHQTPKFLCNTWGDRSCDSRIQQDFILKEIAAAARLGAEVVQIDDGWQKGRTGNSATQGGVWEGFWNLDPGFWEPHPQRFPDGLGSVAAAAKREGVELGLWFAPDSWDEHQHWQRDAELVLGLHRTLGVRYFKFDSVNATTKLAQSRVLQLLAAVRDGSGGAIVVDLDITASARPGYFGAPDCGPLFLENRYTDWHNYWPHHSLRALWTLSRWIDPLRLRMEFLNHERNQDKYQGDPLAPHRYRPTPLPPRHPFRHDHVRQPPGLVRVLQPARQLLRFRPPASKTLEKHPLRAVRRDNPPHRRRPRRPSLDGFRLHRPGA